MFPGAIATDIETHVDANINNFIETLESIFCLSWGDWCGAIDTAINSDLYAFVNIVIDTYVSTDADTLKRNFFLVMSWCHNNIDTGIDTDINTDIDTHIDTNINILIEPFESI